MQILLNPQLKLFKHAKTIYTYIPIYIWINVLKKTCTISEDADQEMRGNILQSLKAKVEEFDNHH